ncbi:manganese efflux pump MntP [Sphingomonas aestuarii]|jgi:putative Mn2+ efflux pump MntP
MSPVSIAILSLSMSADAFAASVGRGAAERPNWSSALKGGAVFGIIEAITPVIGWSLGLVAASAVEKVDHWIAFILLVAVGGRMIWEAARRDTDEIPKPGSTTRKAGIVALVATAIGTSIDAAAVGVGLAFIGVDIWLIAAAIGFTTFVLTTIGLGIGRYVGVRFGSAVEVVGGLLLIGIGSAILADHTGIFG